MSYIQPLITSAFSSYAVNFTARHTAGNQRNDGTTEDKAIGITSGNDKIIADNNTAVIGSVSKTQENKADDGKPKSAFGDVLDLSDRAKNVQAKTLPASKGEFEKVVNFSSEAKSSGSEIELQDGSQSAEAENNVPLAGSLKSDAKGEKLSDEEKQQVGELKARDAEVRLHESRHVAVGGPYVTGGPSYTYQTGPDGKKYAIGGEVGIDVSPVDGDPEATIQKMQTVAAAATAPAEPSSQDYKVAAQARQEIAKAQSELNSQRQSESTETTENTEDGEESQSEVAQNEASKATSFGSGESSPKSSSSITSHYTKSFAAGSIGKMISGGQTSGTRFSAFA